MNVYIDKNAYCDADGNRGQLQWFYELEPSDEDEIYEQVVNALNGYDYEDYPETVTVVMVCQYTEEDIEFEVDVKDFI